MSHQNSWICSKFKTLLSAYFFEACTAATTLFDVTEKIVAKGSAILLFATTTLFLVTRLPLSESKKVALQPVMLALGKHKNVSIL